MLIHTVTVWLCVCESNYAVGLEKPHSGTAISLVVETCTSLVVSDYLSVESSSSIFDVAR